MTVRFFEKMRGILRGQVLTGEPLAPHTTWRVGGPADGYIIPADEEDLLLTLQLLRAAAIPWQVIGGGSNLLIRDGGIRGAVIEPGRLKRLAFAEDDSVQVGAGLPLSTLVREAVGRGLSGIEDLAGIPGTVGGAVAMNAGAGRHEIGQVLRTVLLSGPDGSEEWPKKRLRLGYRKTVLPDQSLVSGAVLQLRRDDPGQLAERMRHRLEQRRKTHRITGPNAGSVFRNPPGGSAWKLIDAAGLRGAREGGARVAEEHANFIVNCGSATAHDIERLIDRVREAVRRKSGILLETEVRIIGEVPGATTDQRRRICI